LDDGRINPAIRNNQTIILASRLGFSKIVEIFLKDMRVKPNAQNKNALRSTILKKHIEFVKILIRNGKVDPNIISLNGFIL
jgi:hypothetical protein